MNRLKKPSLRCAFLLAAVSLPLLPAEIQPQSGPHERAIANAYTDWVETTNAKDLDAWASFLAPDAVFFPPNSPVLAERRAILEFYAALFADDQFLLSCRQEHVEVSEAQDFAWSYGHCEATFTGPDGQVVHGTSKWMKVWRRQPNGEWKCAANSWSSTTPG